ncbi:MAG: fatty acid desaturase [Rhodospirillaceae bacterium]|jgi:acyl-lipid omega-6 desaturase (Delta-12 desaturase)|nr:fatty acid desaturase [Rhodospirillaceae bacterium]
MKIASSGLALPEAQNLSLEEMKALGQKLAAHCRNYRDASLRRSLTQLFLTMGLFLGAFALTIWSLEFSYFLTLILAALTGGLLVRLFIVQHDCGHGAFFKSARANDWLGRGLSLFTVTPYEFWKRAHAIHHANCGNLEKRGIGDISTCTVKEYQALSPFSRLMYRLYRNPVVLFLIGVPIHFAILQRLPFGQPLPAGQVWRSILGLDLALVIFIGGLMYLFGVGAFLSVYLPILVAASIIGGWLFFVQHQYEGVYWARNEEWSFHLAGLLGSSYYVLPKALQWLTGSIGLHHVHHLNSRIPNYRLQECLDASPELLEFPKKLRFLESLKCARLALWDEDNKQMARFADAG